MPKLLSAVYSANAVTTPAGTEQLYLNQGGTDAGITLADVLRAGIKAANLASATTTDVGAATGVFVDVTGTTTITGLGTVQAGTLRILRFTGALLLTYNATSMILPGSANITTAANDVAMFESLGAGNWQCIAYTRRANGPDAWQPVNSHLLQAVRASTVAALTDAATVVCNVAAALLGTLTLAGNRTLALPTNAVAGDKGSIQITQDATGSRTLAYAAGWKFAGGAPTLSTAANAVDVLHWTTFDGTTFNGVLSKAFA